MEGEDQTEIETQPEPEVDPDDQEFDLDADETYEDPDVADEELLAARGGKQWIKRSDLKDPVHGAKYQSVLQRMGASRKAVAERETALAAKEAAHNAAVAKWNTDRATWASEMAKGGAKPPAMKATDPKATVGKGAVGQPVAAGKGAVAPVPGAWTPPATREEWEAQLAEAADARLNARFGAYAEQETEAAKAQQVEADKQTQERWRGDTNAYFSDLWNKGPKNAETKAQHTAAKELLPKLYKAFSENGLAHEVAGNNRWYADFALKIAGHPNAAEVLNLFGTLNRDALYKRKPDAALAFLEATARELGQIPPAGNVTVPREVIEERRKTGQRLDGDMTKADLDKIAATDMPRWLDLLGKNPAYVALYPQRSVEA